MGKFVLLAGSVKLAGNDLSNYGSSAELSLESEAEDATTFGSGGWQEFLAGLKSGSLKVKFKQDMANGALDSIMWPLFGTVATFEVKATQAAVSASNPAYSGNVLISQHTPLSGEVGKIVEADLEFQTSGAVARVTA
ncbi:phage tail tube protein [Amycolatopsis roodepoortensis]|uniref:phage tail tube protein n=1 Tax=Amycolatopsis roodepoortensis TaxID=700274 RepID=UPI00214AE799|nr:phage tail tube protein [Amycolatopsis roodepoortensis]UUV34379.1 phage tail tube protein [Amycolatopsis roodepoortensis]